MLFTNMGSVFFFLKIRSITGDHVGASDQLKTVGVMITDFVQIFAQEERGGYLG